MKICAYVIIIVLIPSHLSVKKLSGKIILFHAVVGTYSNSRTVWMDKDFKNLRHCKAPHVGEKNTHYFG